MHVVQTREDKITATLVLYTIISLLTGYCPLGLGDIEFVTCDYCMRYLLQLLQHCLQKVKHNHIVQKVRNVIMSACFH